MGALEDLQNEVAAKYTVAALTGSLPEKPITAYHKGKPCVMRGMVGRIVGESEEDGSWGEFNGFKAFSIPLFATPHGTVYRSGLGYLGDCNEEQLKLLAEYEQDAKDKNLKLYAGKFDPFV